MEIWIKGIVTAEDTLKAIEMGCDGILVSNHGGRQLDGVPATIDALPECVAAAAGRIRIHIDGGIRSGTDMFKAIALGAEYDPATRWSCLFTANSWVDSVGLAGQSSGDFRYVYSPIHKDICHTDCTQYNGQAGVELMLETYHQEFKRCMQLCGCNSLQDITPACLGIFKKDGPLARL
jgi:(S)-2-hydroxy-acid oxidase